MFNRSESSRSVPRAFASAIKPRNRTALPAGTIGKPVGPAGRRRWHGGRDSGASPIEFAILLPVIVAALFAGIQVSLYFLARSEALAAAQAGVTVQRGYQAKPGSGQRAATAYLANGPGWFIQNPPPAPPVAPPGPPPPPPATVTVTVTGRAMSFIPLWSMPVFTETATATTERITPPGPPPPPAGP